jgi:TPR repeat protein
MTEDSQIIEAEREINNDNFVRAHQILQPLVKRGNAKAIYIAGTISKPGETTEEFERRHVESVELAANIGCPDAIYWLGYFFDVGAEGFEIDKRRASELFKKAANLGHLRSKWIYACELLWGLGSYEQNIPEGLKYLEKSAEGNFDEALETLARIHEQGEFGLEKDLSRAEELRKRIKNYD